VLFCLCGDCIQRLCHILVLQLHLIINKKKYHFVLLSFLLPPFQWWGLWPVLSLNQLIFASFLGSSSASVFVCLCLLLPLSSSASVFVCLCLRLPLSSSASVFVCLCLLLPLSSSASVFFCLCLLLPLSSSASVFVCLCVLLPFKAVVCLASTFVYFSSLFIT
jgi:hypothetical protein